MAAVYEFTFLLPVDNKDVLKAVEGYVKKSQAKIVKEEDMGVKPLSYLIKKQDKAHYKYMELELENEGLKELELKLKLDENLLRYLLVRKD